MSLQGFRNKLPVVVMEFYNSWNRKMAVRREFFFKTAAFWQLNSLKQLMCNLNIINWSWLLFYVPKDNSSLVWRWYWVLVKGFKFKAVVDICGHRAEGVLNIKIVTSTCDMTQTSDIHTWAFSDSTVSTYFYLRRRRRKQCCVQQSERLRTFADWTIENDVRAIVQWANVRRCSLCWTQHRSRSAVTPSVRLSVPKSCHHNSSETTDPIIMKLGM